MTTELLPSWLVGVVAAGAGLSGILVLAVTALSIGGIVTRNLVPNVRPDRQRRISNLVVAAFLVLAGVLTLSGSTIMLTVLNLTYYLLGQLVPGWLALLFFRRVQAWAVSVGIIAGLAASLVLYNAAPDAGWRQRGPGRGADQRRADLRAERAATRGGHRAHGTVDTDHGAGFRAQVRGRDESPVPSATDPETR